MKEIEIAREAAARAQVNPDVAAMIRSGGFDHWPNVKGALIAVRLAGGTMRDGPGVVENF